MSTLVTWKGDTLSNGAFSTSSAGTGDTAPTLTSGGTALTLASATVGTRSPVIKITQASGAAAFTYWQFTGSATIGFRGYWTPTTTLATNHIICRLFDSGTSTQILTVNVTGTGAVRLYNAANTMVAESAAATVAPGNQYRVECTVNSTTDVAEVRIYAGSGGSPIATLGPNTTNYGTQSTRFYIGNNSTTPTSEVQEWDDIVVTDTATFIGAIPGGTTPPTPRVTEVDAVIIDATTSTAGIGGALSYSISQTSGTTTTPTLLTTGKWSVARHATSTLVYTVTVTEAGGTTATDTVTLDPGTINPGVQLVSLVGGIWI